MKKVVYKGLYKLLSVITGKINNQYINHCKIAIGTTLLLLTSGCQTPKKNNKTEDSNKDTVYTDSIQPQTVIDEDILCYESTVVEDSVEAVVPPPPPPPPIITMDDSIYDIITCYIGVYEEDTITVDPNQIYEITEKMPEFPGGSKELLEFIKKNVYFPEEYGDICIQGRAVVQFVVEKDGSVSNAQIIRGIDPKLDEIALEVVNKLPNFEPGMQNNEPVRVKYVVPVTFK